jgi:hypothetical protein
MYNLWYALKCAYVFFNNNVIFYLVMYDTTEFGTYFNIERKICWETIYAYLRTKEQILIHTSA